MNSFQEETLLDKSLMKENAKEGREEGHEPRPLSDPDEPGGLKDGATDRHAAPNLLQESDPQTQPSPISPCPPSPAEAEHLKQQCSYPTPPEAGPASVKRTNDGSESPERDKKKRTKDVPKSPERKRKVAPPPNVWKFTIITIAINNIIDYVDLNNILLFLKDNYLNTTQKIFSLNDENRIFGNVKNKFLVMLDKKKDFININRKHAYRQHALFFFKKKGVSHSEFKIDKKSPYYPKCKGKVHSEDLIIEEIELFLKENDDVSEIWIYTLNSPCLARKNHLSCMYNLIKFSERYPDIQIYIGFSKYYIFTPKINNFCEKAGKQITFNSQFCFTFEDLDSEETCKVQNEKGAETSAELLSTPREKIKERNEDIDGIKSENDESVGLSEEEQLQYNQNVVLTFLNKLQGRYSNLNFFHLLFEEYLNFGSSDNLAHLTNEE